MEGLFCDSIYLKMALRIEPKYTVERMKYNLMCMCPQKHLLLLVILLLFFLLLLREVKQDN